MLAATAIGAPERLFYMSEGKVLQGSVYKPKGNGPFPAVIFNENTAKTTGNSGVDPYPKLGHLFTSKGYVFFVPGRHASMVVEDDGEESAKPGKADDGQRWIAVGKAYLQDVTTAMLTLKAQSFVDPNRIIVMGTIGGATATLFLAEQNLDVRGYVAFSPASGNWKRSPALQEALKNAVTKAQAPIFLLQPRNDASCGPTDVLGPILRSKGKPNGSKVYPPFGQNAQDARSFAITGAGVWAEDVLGFIDQVAK